MHQLWLKRSLILSLAAILTAVACGTSSSTNAGSVKVMATWTGAEQASFMAGPGDRKSTRLNSSHQIISYAVFCLKKKKIVEQRTVNTSDKCALVRHKSSGKETDSVRDAIVHDSRS